MSYEGYVQYIGACGHMWNIDSMTLQYGEQNERVEAIKCPACGQRAKHCCSVDETNGYDENDPHTFPGPVKVVGFTDEWRKDHYDNKFAVKHPTYAPDSSTRWSEVQDDKEST